MDSLVGYTGFVGSNIAAVHTFDGLYNSKNITEAFGTHPDMLVYAGVPAEMYLANSNPEADSTVCENAADNISKIAPERLVLISTIAVLDYTNGSDEEYNIDISDLKPYGTHRYRLEQMVQETVNNCHIIRLPALFGKGLKKNFIYDMIKYVPAMLKADKYTELSAAEPLIAASYREQPNGFYKLISPVSELRSAFMRTGFSAINFTDSRSVFQYYNLAYLWNHIETMLSHNIPLLHAATEPLSAGEIYKYVMGSEFVNELQAEPYKYDMRTIYSGLYGGSSGYIFKKDSVLREIKEFIDSEIVHL